MAAGQIISSYLSVLPDLSVADKPESHQQLVSNNRCLHGDTTFGIATLGITTFGVLETNVIINVMMSVAV